jgi:hypothetical protein
MSIKEITLVEALDLVDTCEKVEELNAGAFFVTRIKQVKGECEMGERIVIHGAEINVLISL